LFIRAGEDAPPTPLQGEAVREAVAKALGSPEAASRSTPEPATAVPAPLVRDTAPPEMRGVEPRLWSAVYSPDGRTIATTAGWDNPHEPGELVLWDVASRRPRVVIRQESTIRTAAFSPDSARIALGDFAGRIVVLDAATAEVVRELPQQLKLVNSLVFSPDGQGMSVSGDRFSLAQL